MVGRGNVSPCREAWGWHDRGVRSERTWRRWFGWLAFVAAGLLSFAPVVSELRSSVLDGFALDAWCEGHDGLTHHPGKAHPGLLDACGYCSFLAHHPLLPGIPVVLMRAPVGLAPDRLTLPAPPRPSMPWMLDVAPRGPPTDRC